jgi:hypothetical protein
MISPDASGVESVPSAFIILLVIIGRKTVRTRTKAMIRNTSKTLKKINGFFLTNSIGGSIGGVWGE